MVPGPIVHINGWPGIGKLTIARQLTDLLPSARLVHNHLLINPADAVLNRTQPGYQMLRKAIRDAIFATLIVAPASCAPAYVFTDFQSADTHGSSVCAEYAGCARARGCAFIPILLVCSEGENMRRVVNAEREVHAKLMDVEMLRSFRREGDVYCFDGHPCGLKLDISEHAPEEAAKIVYEHILSVCPELVGDMEKSGSA